MNRRCFQVQAAFRSVTTPQKRRPGCAHATQPRGDTPLAPRFSGPSYLVRPPARLRIKDRSHPASWASMVTWKAEPFLSRVNMPGAETDQHLQDASASNLIPIQHWN